MSVTVTDVARHLAGLRTERDARASERAARLRSRLPEAALALRAAHGVSDVILFGSLAARGDRPTETCDVDLAVRGLDNAAYFEALTLLMDIFGGPVDLVRLEDAPASLADRIAAEGEAL